MKKPIDFKIELNEESAIVSHFFQNENTKYATPFEKTAMQILKIKKIIIHK